jgi:hypothetical protein
MGGILTWVLRKADGETHVMRRFTNTMPGQVKTADFLRGDKHAVNDAVQFWLNYKADWQRHHQEGAAFEYASSRYLTPYPAPLAPHDYGIIVTDFATGTFLSAQGYSRLDSMLDQKLAFELDPDEDNVAALQELREVGLISGHRIRKPREALTALACSTFEDAHLDDEGQLIFPNSIPYDDLERFCATHRRAHPSINWISAQIEVPGLTIKTFEDGTPSADVLAAIQDLGFTLSDQDLEAWAEYDVDA